MRSISWILFIMIVLSAISCNQETKTNSSEKVIDTITTLEVDSAKYSDEDTLAVVIKEFIQAYSQQNNREANKMIHPDLGLKIIYRPGVSDTFVKVDSIDFLNPVPSYYNYPKLKGYSSTINYSKLPVFDCGTEKWSKSGVYCDTLSHPKQLSTIVTFEREFEPQKYSKAMVKTIAQEEQNSYRIIVTAEHPLIFHVQKYNGAWYVTVLDRAYASCDA